MTQIKLSQKDLIFLEGLLEAEWAVCEDTKNCPLQPVFIQEIYRERQKDASALLKKIREELIE